MLDIKFIRENPDLVQKAALSKRVQIDVAHVLAIDAKYREVANNVQLLRQDRNAHTSGIKGKPTDEQIKKGQEIRERLDKEEGSLTALEQELQDWLYKIPNLPQEDVKVGKDESENDVIRTVGTPKEFSFTPKDHLTLGEALDMIDMERGAKVSGARFDYLKNDGALLEYALLRLAQDVLLQEHFIPIIPPVLIKTETMKGLGYMENGGDEDMFHITKDGLTLIGTAEHALVPLHMGEVLQKKDLPRRYMAYSAAFRRESGSYGKDTRGIFRVHQFNKVEMVSFVAEEDDEKEHDFLLSLEEKFFQLLDIPYQVIKMCTGDLGFPAARKYDIEAWIPSQEKYREVTSVSTVTDFQSRRLNMKYQDGNEKKYLHVLNGTAFSMNRPIIAILENYQQADGSIAIPEILRPYMGKNVIQSSK